MAASMLASSRNEDKSSLNSASHSLEADAGSSARACSIMPRSIDGLSTAVGALITSTSALSWPKWLRRVVGQSSEPGRDGVARAGPDGDDSGPDRRG